MRRSRREDETLMIRVSAFRWVPPFARGLVRDLRVRWALEEAALPYEERLIGPEDQTSESYRDLQPFGQVPAYEEDGLVLFESGAIVLHVAERYALDAHARLLQLQQLGRTERRAIEVHVQAAVGRERRRRGDESAG